MFRQVVKSPTIWKTDRFAVHDGPGIRTALYFKGCPLKCQWCSNPEGQDCEPVLIFREAECIRCGLCLNRCTANALELDREGKPHVARPRCNACGSCVSVCPTRALEVWGRSFSVSEVLDLLEKDRCVYSRSGGGVTLTGGEPFEHPEFVRELLEACSKQGIHAAVETCGYADEEQFRAALEWIDWLFMDLKHMDEEAHLALTGKGNGPILSNLRCASEVLKARGKTLVIRMVLVPGINDGRNVVDLAEFLSSLPLVSGVELLPYHRYGAHKYDLLGRRYGLADLRDPSPELMEECRGVLRAKGLPIVQAG